MFERRTVRDHRGHHPWRFVGQFEDWTIEFTDELPTGRWGLTRHRDRRILIRNGLDQAERRSTLAHETGHMLRGPRSSCQRLYEESLVERQAARLLVPSVRRIGHALAWAEADHEAAAEVLWIDERMLHARLSTLAPAERAWLDEQLALILV